MRFTNGFIRILSLMLLMLLCGCSAAQPGGALPTQTPRPTETAQVQGGTVTVPLPQIEGNIHPLKASTREMLALCGLVFEGLVSFDDSGAPVGALAESWSTEDGKTWVFTLRKNAKWHASGRPIDAHDVVFTLDLLRSLAEESIYGYVFDVVTHYYAQGEQLVIVGKTPFYGLLQALSFPILPRDQGYSATAAPRIPVGTGIFKVDNYTAGRTMELSANPNWWRQQGKITAVKAIAMSDTEEALSALVYSQIDALMTDLTSVGQYSTVGAATNVTYSTRYFEYIAVNHHNGYLKNADLRRAIAYGIDKSALASYVYVGQAIVVDGPVSPESWLYSGRTLTYETDLSRARELIRAAGWADEDGDGLWDRSPDNYSRALSLDLLVSNGEGTSSLRREAANLIKTQLAEVGIAINIKALPYEDYVQALTQGNFDLALCGSYLSPTQDLTPLAGSEGSLNFGDFSSQTMDAALNAVLNAPTAEQMQSAVNEVQNRINEELPFISLYFRTHTLMTVPELQGISKIREENGYGSINQWYFYR